MARVKTIVVGDVHGMLQELRELVELAEYEPSQHRLILAGDLVDRGPESIGVIRYARDMNAEIIQGNHDDKYVRYRKHERKKLHNRHYKNPMKMKSYRLRIYEKMSSEDMDYLENAPYVIPLWEYNAVVVHGGVMPGRPPHRQNREDYIYTRHLDANTWKRVRLDENLLPPPGSIHWTEVYDGTADIIYGHHVQSLTDPVIRNHYTGARTIGLDTGACFGGRLTAIVLTPEQPEGYYIQVDARKTWRERSNL